MTKIRIKKITPRTIPKVAIHKAECIYMSMEVYLDSPDEINTFSRGQIIKCIAKGLVEYSHEKTLQK